MKRKGLIVVLMSFLLGIGLVEGILYFKQAKTFQRQEILKKLQSLNLQEIQGLSVSPSQWSLKKQCFLTKISLSSARYVGKLSFEQVDLLKGFPFHCLTLDFKNMSVQGSESIEAFALQGTLSSFFKSEFQIPVKFNYKKNSFQAKGGAELRLTLHPRGLFKEMTLDFKNSEFHVKNKKIKSFGDFALVSFPRSFKQGVLYVKGFRKSFQVHAESAEDWSFLSQESKGDYCFQEALKISLKSCQIDFHLKSVKNLLSANLFIKASLSKLLLKKNYVLKNLKSSFECSYQGNDGGCVLEADAFLEHAQNKFKLLLQGEKLQEASLKSVFSVELQRGGSSHFGSLSTEGKTFQLQFPELSQNFYQKKGAIKLNSLELKDLQFSLKDVALSGVWNFSKRALPLVALKEWDTEIYFPSQSVLAQEAFRHRLISGVLRFQGLLRLKNDQNTFQVKRSLMDLDLKDVVSKHFFLKKNKKEIFSAQVLFSDKKRKIKFMKDSGQIFTWSQEKTAPWLLTTKNQFLKQGDLNSYFPWLIGSFPDLENSFRLQLSNSFQEVAQNLNYEFLDLKTKNSFQPKLASQLPLKLGNVNFQVDAVYDQLQIKRRNEKSYRHIKPSGIYILRAKKEISYSQLKSIFLDLVEKLPSADYTFFLPNIKDPHLKKSFALELALKKRNNSFEVSRARLNDEAVDLEITEVEGNKSLSLQAHSRLLMQDYFQEENLPFQENKKVVLNLHVELSKTGQLKKHLLHFEEKGASNNFALQKLVTQVWKAYLEESQFKEYLEVHDECREKKSQYELSYDFKDTLKLQKLLWGNGLQAYSFVPESDKRNDGDESVKKSVNYELQMQLNKKCFPDEQVAACLTPRHALPLKISKNLKDPEIDVDFTVWEDFFKECFDETEKRKLRGLSSLEDRESQKQQEHRKKVEAQRLHKLYKQF